ncbi:MAG: STAS domain-containing protein [Bacteroidetes bacterium]|nr:STAS domain-containing protein [Bacteroidota bacterium]MBU1422735.1 STAS domain-containing protein [Bacteroidota bacterium]MBU2635485.1 STAS domain-containing protein [Bacteroidota bacterium]
MKTRTINDGAVGIIEVKSSLINEEEIALLKDAVSDFIEQGIKRVIIDLSKVNLINSIGIGALISAYTNFSRNGGEILLSGVNKSIKNIFIITKLSTVFEIYDKTEEAINKFQLTKINKIIN